MVTEYISVLLIQIVLHFRWTDLLDWKNTQLLHQLQKKVTYSLNFTLGNCKNPGLVTVILGYRMLAGAPHRVVCQPLKSSSRPRATTTTTAVRKQKAIWYYLHVRHVFWFISVTWLPDYDVRSEDVNTRRRCFPLSLKLDTVLKNSNRWKIQAAPTLDELSED